MEPLTQSDIEVIRNAFRECFPQDEPADPASFHPADDVMFLEAFMAGAVSADELPEYRSHLAKCGRCRKTMALYAKTGLLGDEPQEDEMLLQPEKKTSRRWGARNGALIGLCVSIFFAIGFLMSINMDQSKYKVAEKKPIEKSAPAAQTALKELERLLGPEDIQEDCSITALGYFPNGMNPGKDFPLWEDRFDIIEQAYKKAIQETPNNARLRLDFASFLLFQERNLSHAVQVLSNTRSDSAEYYRLMGLCAFLQKDFSAAIERFKLVMEKETSAPSYGDCINLGAAYFQSGDRQAAKPLFERAIAMTSNPRQKEILEKTLEACNSPVDKP